MQTFLKFTAAFKNMNIKKKVNFKRKTETKRKNCEEKEKEKPEIKP